MSGSKNLIVFGTLGHTRRVKSVRKGANKFLFLVAFNFMFQRKDNVGSSRSEIPAETKLHVN